MNKIRKIVLSLLHNSFEDLYTQDGVNLNDGVSEWNICARVAMYMEKRMRAYDFLNRTSIFRDYYVDVEYNRSYRGKPKIVDGHIVRVDLIVQTREETLPNYLVLEMKKPKNPRKRIDDERELNRMVRPRQEGTPDYYNCGSFIGVFLDYNKDTYWGKVFWFDDNINDVVNIKFKRDNMQEIVEQLFG
ncbi:MAG: hypothetical protein J5545_09115 [Bacteroidaceae bacterium]|nr:hypothetical protein [Bacteroidaceae bacterium]